MRALGSHQLSVGSIQLVSDTVAQKADALESSASESNTDGKGQQATPEQDIHTKWSEKEW
jgi:hypothetical protein